MTVTAAVGEREEHSCYIPSRIKLQAAEGEPLRACERAVAGAPRLGCGAGRVCRAIAPTALFFSNLG